MRASVDAAGRLVVPKPLREELGFAAGTELELTAVDGRLEVAVLSRVRVEQGPHGVRFAAETDEPLTTDQVRAGPRRPTAASGPRSRPSPRDPGRHPEPR